MIQHMSRLSARLRDKLERMMLLRVLMVTLLLGSAIVVNINDVASFSDPSYIALFVLIIATYAATIVYAMLVTRIGEEGLYRLAYVQLVGDVLLTGGLVYVTGGTQSVFAFLFYLTIINSAILMGRRAAFVTATLCSAAFLLMLLVQLGVIPEGWAKGAANPTRVAPVYSVVVNIVAYYLVGLLAGYLAQRLEEQDTELERKTLDIRELQALNEHILSSIASGVVTLDTQRRVLFLNKAAEELLGRSISELYGAPAQERLPELWEAVEQMVRESGPAQESWEGWVERRAGNPIFVVVQHSPLFDGQGEHYGHILTIQDLTLVHKMQQRVKRQDRLAAIGQLSAAIAHEVRNPLASISGSVEMLQMFTDPDGDEDRLMQIVIREVDRLNVLIGDFLDYTRDRRHSMSTVKLGALIAETVELFRHDEKLVSELVVEVDVASIEAVTTVASSDGIKQIFWNLLRNAAQAIDGPGEIKVLAQACVGDLQQDRHWEAVEVVGEGQEAQLMRIQVSDTGPGIDEDVKKHLFEPFFTTKRGGTGLGLATIYRIVEDHGGVIGVETSSKGTTFIIDLPVRSHYESPTDMTESALIALSRSARESSTEVSSRPLGIKGSAG